MNKVALTIFTALLLTACSPSAVPDQSAAPAQQQTVSQPGKPVSNQPAKPVQPKKPEQLTTTRDNPVPAPISTTLSANRYILNTRNFRIINQAHPEEKIVLLTFDDGPAGEATLPLLDALDRHQAKSIWFVNGHQLAKRKKDGTFEIFPEKARLLQEIHRRGHLVGNHTWSHENLRKLSLARQEEEMLSTNQVVEQIIGVKPIYFRPPFGAYTDTTRQICEREGMVSVNWSVGSLDWEAGTYKKEKGIANQVLSTVHKGGTILFHDRVWTAQEMDNILAQLTKKGYRFVLPTEAQ